MQNSQYPFPFIGAGVARYSEYCTLYIKFERVPDKRMIEAICLSAPLPIDCEPGDFHSKILSPGSEQFVNGIIELAYRSEGDKKSALEAVYCSTKASIAFENDIERWLKEIHVICRIEVVCRREDKEGGGTEFSEWHYASLKQVDHLLETWSSESPDDYDDNDLVYFVLLLECLASFQKINQRKILRDFLPHAYVFELLMSKNVTELEEFLSAPLSREATYERVCRGVIQYIRSSDRDPGILVCAIRLLVRSPHFGHYMLHHNTPKNHEILSAVFASNDSALLNDLREAFVSTPVRHYHRLIHPIYLHVHNTLQPLRRWDLILFIYDLLIDLARLTPTPLEDLSFYCNTLWVLQKDNTGLAVNSALNEKFLEVCLPLGERNPAIFYNAACLYNEMEQYDTAAAFIVKAVECGIAGQELAGMISDISNAPVFKILRDEPQIQVLRKQWAEEID